MKNNSPKKKRAKKEKKSATPDVIMASKKTNLAGKKSRQEESHPSPGANVLDFHLLRKKSKIEKKKKMEILPVALEKEVRHTLTMLGDLVSMIQEDLVIFKMKFNPQLPSEFMFLEEVEKFQKRTIQNYDLISRDLKSLRTENLDNYLNTVKSLKQDSENLQVLNLRVREASPHLESLKTAALGLFDERDHGVLLEEALAKSEKFVDELSRANMQEFEKFREDGCKVLNIFNRMENYITQYRQGMNSLREFQRSFNREDLVIGLINIKRADTGISELIEGKFDF